MILWTIQHEAAWKRAKVRGVLRADGRRVVRSYRRSYRWIAEQMKARIGRPPSEVRYPIWAWLRFDPHGSAKPDLRESRYLERGEAGVCIEFEAPEDRVLVSDIDLFWWPLVDSYLPVSEADFERGVTHPDEVEKSWQRCLDMSFSAPDVAAPFERKSLQATVWEVPLHSVRRVQRFIAR